MEAAKASAEEQPVAAEPETEETESDTDEDLT
jgi:hypothetical protein